MTVPLTGIDLDQYRTQSRDLLRAARAGRSEAIGRIAKSHPEGALPISSGTLKLADAQLVLARELGFPSWRALKEYVSFRIAVRALDSGDIGALAEALEAFPAAVKYRCRRGDWYETGYFQGATLLHHVAGNPIRCPLPPNIVELTRVLLRHGADPTARNDAGITTIGLILTGKQPSDTGTALPLMDLLHEAGATDPAAEGDALSLTLTNSARATAVALISRGVPMDLRHAAGTGDLAALRKLAGKPEQLTYLEEALAFAAWNDEVEAARELVRLGAKGDVLVRPGGQAPQTALHIAAGSGNLAIVRMLLEGGADATVRDANWNGTPLGWARHCGQDEAAELLQSLTPA